MDKLKPILLPLALVFAAIAIFEFGARYGASNTRAAALTGQLNNFTNLYLQIRDRADEQSRVNLEAVLDNHIATAALVRGAWYLKLKEEPKKTLEAALTQAISLRGEGTMARFKAIQESTEEGVQKLPPARYAEIMTALQSAVDELGSQAPDPAAVSE